MKKSQTFTQITEKGEQWEREKCSSRKYPYPPPPPPKKRPPSPQDFPSPEGLFRPPTPPPQNFIGCGTNRTPYSLEGILVLIRLLYILNFTHKTGRIPSIYLSITSMKLLTYEANYTHKWQLGSLALMKTQMPKQSVRLSISRFSFLPKRQIKTKCFFGQEAILLWNHSLWKHDFLKSAVGSRFK